VVSSLISSALVIRSLKRFIRIVDRNSSAWTMVEESTNKNQYSFNVVDLWSSCLFGFLEKDKILSLCPMMTMHSWPIVFTRLNALYSVVDPT